MSSLQPLTPSSRTGQTFDWIAIITHDEELKASTIDHFAHKDRGYWCVDWQRGRPIGLSAHLAWAGRRRSAGTDMVLTCMWSECLRWFWPWGGPTDASACRWRWMGCHWHTDSIPERSGSAAEPSWRNRKTTVTTFHILYIMFIFLTLISVDFMRRHQLVLKIIIFNKSSY